MKRFPLVNMDMQIPGCITGIHNHAVAFFSTLFNKKTALFFFAVLCSITVAAQEAVDTAYQKVLADRTAKIVNTLDIKDALLYNDTWQTLIAQYTRLNAIQDENKKTVAAIKAKQLPKNETEAAIKKEDEKKALALQQLHDSFITRLKTTLTAEQVEKVKDGMTYRILPVTWAAYLDMLPRLTPEQKDKMYGWLVEARELAMDEGSSDKKHAVFGKYKGRINNYLSAQGYDMKKEGEDWAKRIQASKDTKPAQN